MKVPRHTDFFGRKCSDLGVGRWVSCNLNVVQICKSVQNIGQSLTMKQTYSGASAPMYLLHIPV